MKILFRLILIAIVCTFVGNYTNAQIPAGGFSPNHSFTDLDGNEYNFYNLLDEGKTIIFEISATWCGPCWNYHNLGILEAIHQEFGPNGTDEVRVFFFEGDPETNIDCLADNAGCNNYTYGNWLQGSTYPFSNDNNIFDKYKLNAYPSVHALCPNRQVTNLFSFASYSTIVNAINNCEAASEANDVAVRQYLGETEYLCDEAIPSTYIQNMSTENLTAAVFEVYANGTLMETINWTGNLTTYEYEELTFSPVDLAGQTEIKIVTIIPGDINIENNFVETVVIPVNGIELYNITVRISTDNSGEEAYWAILNSSGEIVFDGGNKWVGLTNGGVGPPLETPPGTYESDTYYYEDYVITESDCYQFVAVDSNGDGWCCENDFGSYQVRDGSGNTIFEDFFKDGAYSYGAFRSIQSAPTAAFSINQSGNSITIIDESDNATEWIWNWGDGTPPVPLQNPGIYTYATNGEYQVCLTVENSFGTDQFCQTFTIPIVGIEDELFNKIKVKPNPANNFVLIDFSQFNSSVNYVQILSIIGQKVKTVSAQKLAGKTEIMIDLVNLAQGIYFVNFFTDEGQFTKKLIIGG